MCVSALTHQLEARALWALVKRQFLEGSMTRTKTIATLWCTALVATLAAYGCGSSSTIDNGAGGSANGAGGHANGAGGGIVIVNTGGTTGSGGITGGTGGMTGGGMGGMVTPPGDAGAPMCVANAMCTAPFTCDGACRQNGMNGTRACMCGNNGRLACGACILARRRCAPAAGRRRPAPRRGYDVPGQHEQRPCVRGRHVALALHAQRRRRQHADLHLRSGPCG